MAFDSAEELSRRSPPGVWRMDHMEASIRGEPKRVPVSHRIRLDESIGRLRHNPNLVGAWVICFVFTATVCAAVAQIIWGF